MNEIDAVKNIKAYMYYALDELPRDVGIALTEAIVALREQAERSKGCGFCCYQEHPDKTLYPKEGYAFYAGFSKQIDVDDFDEIETDEIKYCPMCGRILEENNGGENHDG